MHYKGESTKKGELQYVKLFYGAMLRFAEKHLHDRYSRLFVWLLRGGVVARAGMTLIANTLRRLALPLLDFVLVAATVLLLGLLRSAQTGVSVPLVFYALVAPGYALCTTASIALIGGYRRRKQNRARTTWIGALLGLLIISTLSFFAKELAFSRAVVLVSFPASALLLSVLRWQRRSRRAGPRRAVLVGHPREARRLRTMLSSHPHPPFQLTGYVSEDADATDEHVGDLPHLGTARHLRDLVRLRRIDDVVFAADGLSNQSIFGLMQHLRDLPVQTRILAAGREHVIGKATINDLSTPALIEAEEALGTPRSRFARRLFEIVVALGGLLLYPLVGLLKFVTGDGSRWRRLAAKMRRLPAVLTGKLALVGYHPEENFRPPPEWDLRPGLFAVTDTLPTIHPTPEEMSQAYWFYVRNQSAFLDWTLLWHAIGSSGP